MAKTRTKEPKHTVNLVRNHSSRMFAPIQAIAVHSTESNDIQGSRDDLNGIQAWFDNPASQASSHLGIDGDGYVMRYVRDDRKAWTILDLNSVTLNIEFVGRASQPESAWEDKQLRAGARWIAYWSRRYGIPIQKGNVRSVAGRATITKKGVIRHSDLTAAGFGTHGDPGRNFPLAEMLRIARDYRRTGWEAD